MRKTIGFFCAILLCILLVGCIVVCVYNLTNNPPAIGDILITIGILVVSAGVGTYWGLNEYR